jgi:hypothetical protein
LGRKLRTNDSYDSGLYSSNYSTYIGDYWFAVCPFRFETHFVVFRTKNGLTFPAQRWRCRPFPRFCIARTHTHTHTHITSLNKKKQEKTIYIILTFDCTHVCFVVSSHLSSSSQIRVSRDLRRKVKK